MTATPNLAVEHIASSSDQKEVQANDAFDAFDAAMTETLTVSVASGNGAPTVAEMQGAACMTITGATVPGRTVAVPTVKRFFLAGADSANTQSVALTRGSTSLTLTAGDLGLFFSDGTANGLWRVSGSASAFTASPDVPDSYSGQAYKLVRIASGETAVEFVEAPFEASVTVNGKPDAAEVLARHKMAGAVRFPAGLTNSQFTAGTAATASAVFTLAKNGASFGTMTVGAGATTATLAAASATDFAAGDILTLTAPAIQDATLADLGLTMWGVRR